MDNKHVPPGFTQFEPETLHGGLPEGVGPLTVVEVINRQRHRIIGPAETFYWGRMMTKLRQHIIGYRVVEDGT